MYAAFIFVASASIALVGASPILSARNPRDDPLLVTFWENGCGVDGTANRATFVYSSEGPSYPGECVGTGLYNWQSLQVAQDSASSYSIELFSGEGCNNPYLTVDTNGCYTQPEGQIILSVRASLK